MNCPECNSQLGWQSDFMCDEVHGCECEDGIVSFQYCGECDDLYTYTTDCRNIPNGLEKCPGEEED